MFRNLVFGLVLVLSGTLIRVNARDLAWPSGNFGYSGPRAETRWAIQEKAYSDIGIGCFYLGGLFVVGGALVQQFQQARLNRVQSDATLSEREEDALDKIAESLSKR